MLDGAWINDIWQLSALFRQGQRLDLMDPIAILLLKTGRMALRNPLDNGGLFTVTKCKTDLALSFALWNIHHHQIPVRGETVQSCKPILPLEQFGSGIQLGGHSLVFIGTLSLLWLTESKDRGEIFLLITIRSLKMLLTQIILAASLYFCVEKKHEKQHLLLWISFWRVSLLLWQ